MLLTPCIISKGSFSTVVSEMEIANKKGGKNFPTFLYAAIFYYASFFFLSKSITIGVAMQMEE